MRYLVPVLLAVGLMGCMFDSNYRMNRFADRCTRYGFSPGTTAFSNCLQQEELNWRLLMTR
jgi:hypothetical protein